MNARPELVGWLRHALLSVELNFRNPQAMVYGYLVPVIFLLAFGSVFRADTPPLLAHMGQIMTITILGGALFRPADGAGWRSANRASGGATGCCRWPAPGWYWAPCSGAW